MTGVFVTAIGTECGKTHISCALIRALRAQGARPLALKPLMSGYSVSSLDQSDAGRLLAAMGRTADNESIAEICWKALTDPLAPNVAARRAGIALDYAELLAFVRSRTAAHDGIVLVEGAGGVMSPLTDTATNLDLAADLGLPVMLLATSYLGAVSHTLTALKALRTRDLIPALIVVTEPTLNAAPASDLIDELKRWTQAPLLAAPFDDGAGSMIACTEEIVRRLFAQRALRSG